MKKIIALLVICICSTITYGQNTYLQMGESYRSINRNTLTRIAGTHSLIDTVCITTIPPLSLKQWGIIRNDSTKVLDSTKIFFLSGKSCYTRKWTTAGDTTYTYIKPTYPLN